ncbi:MAG: AMP-binding protein, partial [Hydrogenophaga sp.]
MNPESAARPLSQSLAAGATDVPLIEVTIGAHFDAVVARQPDHEALVSVHQGLRFSYRQLQAQANRLASALLRQDLQPGDRVGIWSHNNAEWVLMQLATAKAGLVLVNINPAYRTSEVEYALNKVGCKLLVTMARFKTSDYLGMLRELAPEWSGQTPGKLSAKQLPHLHTMVWIDGPADGPDLNTAGLLPFSALLAQGDANDPRVTDVGATLKATDPINIQFTSGTT